MDLYQAILSRNSVRRYERSPLPSSEIKKVQEILGSTEPLVPENQFRIFSRDGLLIDKDFITSMGAYGYIVSPPHILAPYIIGIHDPLVDLGYRVEQIVVRLTQLNLGTCYIGTLSREESNRDRLGLPQDSRCGALLAFGYPAKSTAGRMLNSIIRSVPAGQSRLPEEECFFHRTFEHPALPPQHIRPIITAARYAPSAVNAQPWRFLWLDDRLYLFLTKHNRRYGRGPSQEYRLYDGGICMANVKLALDALGMEGRWNLIDKNGAKIPNHPKYLEPLAILQLHPL